jgi:hypothetical protein
MLFECREFRTQDDRIDNLIELAVDVYLARGQAKPYREAYNEAIPGLNLNTVVELEAVHAAAHARYVAFYTQFNEENELKINNTPDTLLDLSLGKTAHGFQNALHQFFQISFGYCQDESSALLRGSMQNSGMVNREPATACTVDAQHTGAQHTSPQSSSF